MTTIKGRAPGAPGGPPRPAAAEPAQPSPAPSQPSLTDHAGQPGQPGQSGKPGQAAAPAPSRPPEVARPADGFQPPPPPSRPPQGAPLQPPQRSVASEAKSAADALVTGATMVNPPSVLSPPVPGAPGVTASSAAHGASATATRATPGGSESVAADVSRATLTVSASRTEPGRERTASASLAKDYLGVTAGGAQGKSRGSATLAFSSGSLSAGFDLAQGGARGTFTFGLLGTVSGDRKVADLGPAEGGRRVELTTSRGEGLWLAAGLATPALAAGATLSIDRSREVKFRTTIADGAARQELHEGGKLRRFAEAKAQAFGLEADALKPPALDQPEKLKVGDELEVAVRGSFTGGLALGAMGVRAGAQGTLRGDFDLKLKKLSSTQVELVVTPTQVRGLQLFVDTPSPLEVDHTRVRAKSLSQGFVFDLSQPGAKAAFLAAVSGELPAALGGLKSAAPADAGALVNLVRTEPLPAGVQRTFVEGLEAHAVGTGGGLDFGIVERLTGVVGLSARTTRVSEDRARTDGQTAVVESSRGVERRREVLLSGKEALQVFGSVRTRLNFDDAQRPSSQFEGLKLSAVFSDDKVRGDELDDEVVGKLNEALGLGLAPFEREGRGLSRTVRVELTLDAAALAELARARPEDEAGMLLVEGLQDLGPQERAEAVRDFVAHGGLEAMGQVRRWAAVAPATLAVTTESGAYDASAAAARSLGLKYQQPISLAEGAGAVTRRFEEVTRALAKTREAQLDAQEDPFLDGATRPQVAAALESDRAALEGLISVAHLAPQDRAALHQALDRGWTTGAEHRLMQHLEQAAAA